MRALAIHAKSRNFTYWLLKNHTDIFVRNCGTTRHGHTTVKNTMNINLCMNIIQENAALVDTYVLECVFQEIHFCVLTSSLCFLPPIKNSSHARLTTCRTSSGTDVKRSERSLGIDDSRTYINFYQDLYNEMFKLALANASRHVLLRSKVLEEVVIMLCYHNHYCTSCQ